MKLPISLHAPIKTLIMHCWISLLIWRRWCWGRPVRHYLTHSGWVRMRTCEVATTCCVLFGSLTQAPTWWLYNSCLHTHSRTYKCTHTHALIHIRQYWLISKRKRRNVLIKKAIVSLAVVASFNKTQISVSIVIVLEHNRHLILDLNLCWICSHH